MDKWDLVNKIDEIKDIDEAVFRLSLIKKSVPSYLKKDLHLMWKRLSYLRDRKEAGLLHFVESSDFMKWLGSLPSDDDLEEN